MNFPTSLALTLGAALLLAGCSEKTSGNAAPAQTNAAEPSGKTADVNMTASETKTARGTGTVTTIDKAAGTVTLDHGPIAEAGWPAMTMAFKAQPQLLESVSVGDKVAFDVALGNGTSEVTAIRRQ